MAMLLLSERLHLYLHFPKVYSVGSLRTCTAPSCRAELPGQLLRDHAGCGEHIYCRLFCRRREAKIRSP